MSTSLLARAYALARSAHNGQVDKAGQPYFDAHVADVVRRVAAYGGSDTLQAVALLHDVIEDTPVTLVGLRLAGYPERVAAAVDAISQRRGETRDDYRKRVRQNPAARAVKFADHESNTTRTGTTDGQAAADRRAEKYRRDTIRIGLCAYPHDRDGEHNHTDCADALFQDADDYLAAEGAA